jgi:hypothetical protein
VRAAWPACEALERQVAVPIDFGKLAGGEHPPLISPRDIFASLPGRAAGFGYLRDV